MNRKKNIIIVLLLLVGAFSSCSDWLDVSPKDQVGEKELFEKGEGFRTALNGVYQSLSTEDLYGRNLTWGFVEALSQVYDPEKLKETNDLSYAMEYKYNVSFVKNVISSIWEKMYKSIANCNNIIQNIEHADADIFAYKEWERDLIRGEAYALRGFLHFDLLRLFAPAPAVDDGGSYIPYCETFPAVWSPRKKVTEILDKVIADLLKAREISAQDTLEDNIKALTDPYSRIDNGHGWPERGTFFRMRGTHMNYHNITALLARVYLYAGNLEEAYKYALEAVEFEGYDTPNSWDYSGNPKSKEDAMLCFFNTLVTDYHQPFFGDDGYLAIRHATKVFEDQTDYRWSKMTTNPETKSRVSVKYKELESASDERVSGPLIPVLRRGEIILIVSEYMARHAKDIKGAIEYINENLRKERGCTTNLKSDNLTESEYFEMLLLEARRELIEEGQIFFMHKRLNQPIWNGSEPKINVGGNFVLPLPDSENI